jgi:O-antigen biosynthesis protein WbqV
MAIAFAIFAVMGLGRGIWRFASLTDLRFIVIAATVVVLTFLVAKFLIDRLDAVPRSVPIVAWFILIVLLGAPRLAHRVWRDEGLAAFRRFVRQTPRPDNLLMIGGVAESDKAIRTYGLEASDRYHLRGIIDYTSTKTGRRVRGIPVLGTLNNLPSIMSRMQITGTKIDALLVATGRENKERLRAVMAVATQLKVPVRRISGTSLQQGEPNLEDITLDDLLGRPPINLDLTRIRALIEGKVVIVTGAGGSIGSEIARQVAANDPERLVILDHSEYNLYQIDQELANLHPNIARIPVIASVRDRRRIAALFQQERPAIVFHAAALKHVPLVEGNISEGVLTNVVGTRIVADAAVAAGVGTFVMISTDKAIRPTNVMGASKRAAEAYCQSLDISGVSTRFVTVRFGNVLGSTGSVVPLFLSQIKKGGPITVTDPEMRRYFMTIREATELVLQAAAAGAGRSDHRGRIMVLDMGEPVRIVDLARTMISLAGYRPDDDIPIVFTGLRPGEKLFEELFDAAEVTIPAGVDGVLIASAQMVDSNQLIKTLDLMEAAASSNDSRRVRALLASIVPELPHDQTAGTGLQSSGESYQGASGALRIVQS